MTTPGFRPTHVVPQHGMPAWEAPDTARPTADLDPLLPVQLLERQGDWGHVLCFNGWSAWVDGRRLVAVPQDPPTTDGPLTRTADPRPLLARAEEALSRYRSAVEDLAHGLDGETFRTRTRGLRIGVVIDGESMWLYDAAHGHWVYADGTRLTPYATDETPRSDPGHRQAGTPPARPPTRVVPPDDPAAPSRAEQPSRPPDAPPTRVVPDGPPAAPDPARGVTPEAPQGHDPTRVVPPEAPGGHDPTRVVSAEGPAAPPPTRVVSPGEVPSAPEPPRTVPSERPAGAEPTRVVSPGEGLPAAGPSGVVPPEASGGHDPTRVVSAEGPAAPPPTRVVSPGEVPSAPEPTRVVSPDAHASPAGAALPEPTRVVSAEEMEAAEEAERAGGATAARGVGREPTRIVTPEGDGR
ncbi:hypothetical protein ACPXCS_34190 [Streptomyces sp. DT190]|uniref:hypothetical protein n=1 Tax=unclassified Streptomyces TaxID=2593676 RepID=UPI003CEDDC9D